MSIDVKKLAMEVLQRLNKLIEDIQIPDDVFKEFGLSGFEVSLYEDYDKNFKDDESEKKLQSAKQNFERLCESTFAPAEAVRSISLGYAIMAVMIDPDFGLPDEEDVVRNLLAIETCCGNARGILSGIATILSEQKSGLSDAGKKGAEIRNKKYEAVKTWARDQASGMRGADRDIAKMLAVQMPMHLADKSKDPTRLIYDALRSARKVI